MKITIERGFHRKKEEGSQVTLALGTYIFTVSDEKDPR